MTTPFQRNHDLNLQSGLDLKSGLDSASSSQIHNPLQTPVEINSRAFFDVRFQLTSVLQTSLDITDVIRLFFRNVQSAVQLNSMRFEHPSLDIDVRCGLPSKHNCSYRLISEKQVLGNINFTRTHSFLEQEMCVLEALISTLICPLRNALMYREALQTAMKDPLTGLGSRAALENAMAHDLKMAQRYQYPFSLLVLDIDRFKGINDTYGHSAGDIVLKEVAQAIIAITRQTDQAFRFGGEEFVVLLEKTDEEGAHAIADRIRQRIERLLVPYQDQHIVVTASIGVASVTKEDTVSSLFDRADEAMYFAKQNGRNRVISCSELANLMQETSDEIEG